LDTLTPAHACFQHAQRHRGIPLHAKGARNGSTCETTRATLGGAPRTARPHPNALPRALHGPGVARPRTQPQKRHARVPSTRTDASRDPFALKSCVLEICGTSKLLAERPTSRPANSIISSVTRVVTREWRIHPHMHRNTLHADFGPAKTPPWTPLHSKRAHNIRHLRERAHLSLIKMHHVAFLLA